MPWASSTKAASFSLIESAANIPPMALVKPGTTPMMACWKFPATLLERFLPKLAASSSILCRPAAKPLPSTLVLTFNSAMFSP